MKDSARYLEKIFLDQIIWLVCSFAVKNSETCNVKGMSPPRVNQSEQDSPFIDKEWSLPNLLSILKFILPKNPVSSQS